MSQKIITTRIVLRNGAASEWVTKNPVLLAGEAGVEIDTKKMKIGDGTTAWNDLPYSGIDQETIEKIISQNRDNLYQYTRTSLDQTHDAAISAALGASIPKQGDIVVITTDIDSVVYEQAAYSYDGTQWVAMTGNVDATKVIMQKDIITAGKYTRVGNVTKSSETSTGTFSVKGKSVQQAIEEILSQRLQPDNPTQPYVNLTFSQAKAYEVGSKVTPSYSASFNSGSYQYGPSSTGVTVNSWEISDTDGNTAATASGSFPEITVTPSTSYKITAKANHTAGLTAFDNLGDASNPVKQIAAGAKTKTSGAITGYRSYFYGYKGADALLDVANLTSANIRALSNKNTITAPTSITTNKMQQIFFAFPKGTFSNVTVANSTNGAPQTVYGPVEVAVEGANGYEAVPYDIFYVNNASAESGSTTFKVTCS